MEFDRKFFFPLFKTYHMPLLLCTSSDDLAFIFSSYIQHDLFNGISVSEEKQN